MFFLLVGFKRKAKGKSGLAGGLFEAISFPFPFSGGLLVWTFPQGYNWVLPGAHPPGAKTVSSFPWRKCPVLLRKRALCVISMDLELRLTD